MALAPLAGVRHPFSTIAVLATLSLASSASADVTLGVRAGAGGGMGQSARPVYGGLAGIDGSAELIGKWGVGLSIERTLIERPEESREISGERHVSLFSVWTLPRRRNNRMTVGQIAIGAGYRSFRRTSNDPLLGDVEVRGWTLLHMRTFIGWAIADRVDLGIGFDWNLGIYTSASYVDPSDYVAATDREPPEIRQGVDMTNIYSIGPRLSLTID